MPDDPSGPMPHDPAPLDPTTGKPVAAEPARPADDQATDDQAPEDQQPEDGNEDSADEQQPADTLTVERRRAIFRAIVETQDGGTNVADSRLAVAEKFAVSETQVKSIEREGLENQWPPL